MTHRTFSSHWLPSALLGATVGMLGQACGDDDSTQANPLDASSGAIDAGDAGGRLDAEAGSAPATGDGAVSAGDQACLAAVYEPLDDQCKACVCMTNAETAPVCDGPCWEFLACAAAANAGPCAQFALGTQQNSECTATNCGAELSVPGVSTKASAYGNTGIGRACFAGPCAASLGAISSKN